MGDLINRQEYIDKLLAYKDKDIIKVVTGLRRSGKSTLFELFKNNLIATGIQPGQIQLYIYELNYERKVMTKYMNIWKHYIPQS